MQIGIIVNTNDAETIQNALEYANYALAQKDSAKIYLLGKGVEIEIHDKMEGYSMQPFTITKNMKEFIEKGGEIMASGKCLAFRELGVPEFCRTSSMAELHTMIKESDKIISF